MKEPSQAQIKVEFLKCYLSFLYFVETYCFIYDGTEKRWIAFHLWAGQISTAQTILNNPLVVILKARQLGLSWLVLAYALWLMLFHPAATILLFSKRDNEAMYLLGDERLKGMYKRLPRWLQAKAVIVDSKHEWQLSNGSIARAFPTTAGDSYTATLAIVDEVDLIDNFDQLMDSVKPTIDGGGRMILLSRSDKNKPNSGFKRVYRAAKENKSPWVSVFLPWWVRPNRTAAWYEAQKADVLARTGSVDSLYAQYPATDTEALAPNSLNKRIHSDWINQCYVEQPTIEALSIPQLQAYKAPEVGKIYVLGGDPAEGNPTSDDSALTVLDAETGEEVASLAGKIEITLFASYINQVGTYFNQAAVLVERNNHGHAVLLWLSEHSKLTILDGQDGKPGWQTSGPSKALMYSNAADAFRDKATTIHNFATVTQLQSIDGASLSAPEGEQDDRAMSYVLALMAQQNPAAAAAKRLLDGYKKRLARMKEQQG